MTEQQAVTITFTVQASNKRVDKLVVAHIADDHDLSRSQVQTLIKDGLVTVDGEPTKPGVKLSGGETVRVVIPPPEDEDAEPEPEPMALDFVYEDDDLAVLNKPAGLVVHPGVGHESGTLVNALIARYPNLLDTDRKGIVHRLDKETSGLMVIGKHEDAIQALMGQFKARTVDKAYLALTEREPRTEAGVIDAPIGRDPKQRKRMAVVRDGKSAVTEFEVLENDFLGDQALIRCVIHTGRTHQIRVHLAFVGAPIVGDTVYGYRKQRIGLKRHFLHAAELAFDHPVTGERLAFTSDLPPGLQNTLDKLRRK